MKRSIISGIIVVLALASLFAADDKKANVLLQAALAKETIQGDLKGAIELYQRAVKEAGGNRALAAQALLHEAECHQKLGDTKARNIYERVVRDYADQKDASGVARARLATMTTNVRSGANAESPLTSRRLWNKYVMFGVPSGDGRYVTFVDFDADGTGNLFLRDLNTGTNQQLTNGTIGSTGVRPNYAGESAFSADGGHIAYGWKRPEGYQLRVISRAGTGERIVTKNPEHEWIAPVAWSLDRSRILVKINAKGDVGQIAWVSVADGAVQVLKTAPWAALGRLSLSPDGRFIAYDERVEARPAARTIFVLSENGQQHRALTDGSSRDEVVGWLSSGSLAYLTYRSGSPELWAVQVRDGSALGAATIVKREMGGIYESLGFAKTGALFYTQVVSTGTAHIATVDWAAAQVSDVRTISTNLVADFGPDWSPDGKHIAYVAHRGTDIFRRFIAVYSVADGSTREVVPAEDLSIAVTGGHRWSPDGTSYLVNGADAAHKGAHAIDLATGKLRAMIQVANGYPQTPRWLNGGKSLLYHPREQLKLSGRLTIRDQDTGIDRDVRHAFEDGISIGLEVSPDERTLAYVPIFDKAPNYSLQVMPLHGGASRLLVQVPSDEGLWPLGWTPDSQHVIYQRSKSGERRQVGPRAATSGVWIVPVSGGQPRQVQMPLAASGALGAFRVHPDGRQVTFNVSENQIELWTLENVPAGPTSSRR